MELEELFRSKLENSELIPGDGVRADLMHKLARKEFLRFNPSRFNIYYLSGIVAAAVTAAIIVVTSYSASNDEKFVPPAPGTVTVTGTDPVANVDLKKPAESDKSRVRKPDNEIESPPQPVTTPDIAPRADDNPQVKETNENNSDRSSDTLLKSGIIMKKLTPESTAAYQLQKKSIASFDVSVTSGCLPLRVKFTNRSTGSDSCRWSFGDGGNSTEKEPVWLFDVAGEYKVILKVYGSGGTESYSERIVNVYPRPKARFEIEPQAPIIPDDQVRFLNYSTDAVKYRWEFGDGKVSEALEPEHKYTRYSSYNVRLIVWSEHGCSDSMLVTDAFATSGCFINFPNAFIPNADGPSGGNYSSKSDEAAQIFHPVTSGVSEYQLRIFSKTGILIFESNDLNTGWDGYHKGQLCESGVYIWKVRGIYKNGEPFVKMGDVTLLKR